MTNTTSHKSKGFSDQERAAMRERALELKSEERANKDRAFGEKELRGKIAEMPEPDRAMATKVHEIVSNVAPMLMPKTWYGMPAYTREGKVVCFFKAAYKYKSRYATLGFEEAANLDDGAMWPTTYALTKMTPTEIEKITALVKKAAGVS